MSLHQSFFVLLAKLSSHSRTPSIQLTGNYMLKLFSNAFYVKLKQRTKGEHEMCASNTAHVKGISDLIIQLCKITGEAAQHPEVRCVLA